MTPDVAVIIPAHNDAARLQACVDLLDRQTYPRDRMEVVVVDNASDPPLAPPTTRRVPVRLLREPVPGSYRARNTALRTVTAPVLAFTDADCLPAEDWVERGVAAIGDPDAPAMVAGRVEVFAADPAAPTAVELWELATGFPQARYLRQERFGVTANLFTTAATLARVGPFDERLASGGDYEWGRRAADAGVPQRFGGDVVVRHPARRTMAEIRGKLRRTVRGRVALEPPAKGPAAGVWLRRLAPPLSGWATILTSPALHGPAQRLKAGAVMAAVKYLTAYEYLAARGARGTAIPRTGGEDDVAT